jgi:hypothetical protein
MITTALTTSGSTSSCSCRSADHDGAHHPWFDFAALMPFGMIATTLTTSGPR